MEALQRVRHQQVRGEIPDEVKVPDGEVLLFTALGEGVQIYDCTASAAGTGSNQFGWSFKEPRATLFDDEGNVVAVHYGGPTWQSMTPSRVLCKKQQ